MRGATSPRPPQQDRSRATQERIVASAISVLERRGYQDFTLQEVCNGSGLSIGAIYSRFSGKEELLRTVQARLIETLDAEVLGVVTCLSAENLSFRHVVLAMVTEFAGLFRKHHSLLRPLMAIASTDPIMGQEGRKWDVRTAKYFRVVLLKHRSEIRHPNPERAVNVCFDVIFASVTRFLGLGTAPDVRGRGKWPEFVDDLGRMACAFLLHSTDE